MNQLDFHFERGGPRRPPNQRLRIWLRRTAIPWGCLVSVLALLWFLFIKLTHAVLAN